MDKRYDHKKTEEKIYKMWEEGGYFTPQIDPDKKPFTILLPPPNANDPLHAGHSLFTVEDILCRWHRMKGDPTLFLPGTDHAGIETQYVFEKELRKQGKSRFDFDRNTLYRIINNYVEKNRGIAKKQLKRHGFSLDWSREKYTLDPKLLKTVLETFRKLHQDELIYRAERIVNYCPHCGTAFSNLEVNYREQKDNLFYLDYGPLQIATTRPETIFADTAVAVHPEDKRYRKLIGKKAILPLVRKELPIIADKLVDPEFGTGALKITPGHDPTDFEIGQKHNLKTIKIINLHGKMINLPEKYQRMTVGQARKAVVEDLKKSGKLVQTKPLTHSVGLCYRCKNPIEPLTMPQWFVKIKPLAQPAIEVAKTGKLKIFPKRFIKTYLQWMENIQDWNISRQIVWGPRIPAWYCLDCNPKIFISFINKKGEKIEGKYKKLRKTFGFAEIKNGLQSLVAPKDASYSLKNKKCPDCGSKNLLQETDTFDTWFSSGQWPLTTLGYPDSQDFKYFYPTSVLDTMWDILFFWVARMVMFGLYLADDVPFKVAHMHCRVVDKKGQKMSKSRGNVVNPMELIEKYGADALRIALVFGNSPGSDIPLSDDKVRAMRNFANKVWNIGRFILLNFEKTKNKIPFYNKNLEGLTKKDKKIIKDLQKLITQADHHLTTYRFDWAAEKIYHFVWHRFADEYVEYTKDRLQKKDPTALSVLRYVYLSCLKLLHPFMPFVTEKIWNKMPKPYDKPLIISKWPIPSSHLRGGRVDPPAGGGSDDSSKVK